METLYPKSRWTEEENKKFESAIAMIDERSENRWLKVAAMIPGKSVLDVMKQYQELVADVTDIEAGFVPGYYLSSSRFVFEYLEGDDDGDGDGDGDGEDEFKDGRKRARRVDSCDHERKKGVPWTEDEHRRFLLGLKEHGKGDWRSISRNFVISKTPTQVASHAQKYYLRQLSGGKDKRRPSIHDITIENNNRPPAREKCDELIISSEIPTINEILDNSNGSLMAAFHDSFITHPYNIATNDRYVVKVGGFNQCVDIESWRF